ncbi:hypothetical protein ACLOJK_018907 [Asimina triloba]
MLVVQVGYGIRLRLGFWGFWSGTHLAALMLGGTEMLLPLDRLFGMRLLESAQWLRMQSDGGRTTMAALLGSWLVAVMLLVAGHHLDFGQGAAESIGDGSRLPLPRWVRLGMNTLSSCCWFDGPLLLVDADGLDRTVAGGWCSLLDGILSGWVFRSEVGCGSLLGDRCVMELAGHGEDKHC